MPERKEPVYAVVRLDRFDGTPAESVFENPSEHITVKEVFPTYEEADSEARRLNELNKDKGCVYFATPSRFFPSGR